MSRSERQNACASPVLFRPGGDVVGNENIEVARSHGDLSDGIAVYAEDEAGKRPVEMDFRAVGKVAHSPTPCSRNVLLCGNSVLRQGEVVHNPNGVLGLPASRPSASRVRGSTDYTPIDDGSPLTRADFAGANEIRAEARSTPLALSRTPPTCHGETGRAACTLSLPSPRAGQPRPVCDLLAGRGEGGAG